MRSYPQLPYRTVKRSKGDGRVAVVQALLDESRLGVLTRLSNEMQ